MAGGSGAASSTRSVCLCSMSSPLDGREACTQAYRVRGRRALSPSWALGCRSLASPGVGAASRTTGSLTRAVSPSSGWLTWVLWGRLARGVEDGRSALQGCPRSPLSRSGGVRGLPVFAATSATPPHSARSVTTYDQRSKGDQEAQGAQGAHQLWMSTLTRAAISPGRISQRRRASGPCLGIAGPARYCRSPRLYRSERGSHFPCLRTC